MQIDLSKIEMMSDAWSGFVRDVRLFRSSLKLRELLHIVRDIPYGRPSQRTTDCTIHEWIGTCSDKHVLMQEFLHSQEIKSKMYIGNYQVKPQIIFSSELNFLLGKYRVFDVHNYLVVSVDNNEIIVDVTWPIVLQKFGFCVNADFSFDGMNSNKLAVETVDSVEITSLIDGCKLKKDWLTKLNIESYEIREQVILEYQCFFEKNFAKISRVESIRNSLGYFK